MSLVVTPNTGMNLDSDYVGLTPHNYTYALNLNIAGKEGNIYTVQNERGNTFMTSMPDGFDILCLKYDNIGDRVIAFSTDKSTLRIDRVEIAGLVGTIIPIVQLSCETYSYFDYRILENDIHFKIDNGFVYMYWTGVHEIPFFLNLDDQTEHLSDGVLDCDKLRVFNHQDRPIITLDIVQNGGILPEGVYSYYVAYCDGGGEALSSYYSDVNNIIIADKESRIYEDLNYARSTTKGVRLNLRGLDMQYNSFKVICLYHSPLDGKPLLYDLGVFDTASSLILHGSNYGHNIVPFETVYARRPYYEKTGGLAVVDNRLMPYNLHEEEVLNIQPLANLLGAHLKWGTSIAFDSIYKDATNTSKYRGYLRDEVYPFSIRFYTKSGNSTHPYVLINRPKSEADATLVNNEDSTSVNASTCGGGQREERWEYYDTSSVLGSLEGDVEYTTVNVVNTLSCVTEGVKEVYDLPLTLPGYVRNDDILLYLNDNRDVLCDVGGALSGNQFCSLLDECYTTDLCTVSPGDTCGPPILEVCDPLRDNYFGDITVGSVTYTETPLEEYVDIHLDGTGVCNKYAIDTTNGGAALDPDGDTFFAPMTGMHSYRENPTKGALKPKNAVDLQRVDPNSSYSIPYFLNGLYACTLEELLQPSYKATPSDVGEGNLFYDDLSAGAIWFKATKNTKDSKFIIELTEWAACPNENNDYHDIYRVTIYDGYSFTTFYSSATYNQKDHYYLELPYADFTSDTIYIAVDSPIEGHTRVTWADSTVCPEGNLTRYIVEPPCSCFLILNREVEYDNTIVDIEYIRVDTQPYYTSVCTYQQPTMDECTVVPYEKGRLGYWESELLYPENDYLYDSSAIKIRPTDFPSDTERLIFEESYTDGVDTTGHYILVGADFRNQKIRHYKMPSNSVSPYMDNRDKAPFASSLIYPLGIMLDPIIVSNYLDIGVRSGVLSQSQRDSIVGFEILRGDRVLHKSILGKGVLYDCLQYNDKSPSSKQYLYSNYPYNDLGEDIFVNDPKTGAHVQPLYGSGVNKYYTFHSPEFHYATDLQPTEIKVEGFTFGHSKGGYYPVEGHPHWVLLGSNSYTLATIFSTLEVTLRATYETMLYTANALSRMFVGMASNIGAVAAISLIAAAAATQVALYVIEAGKLRYEWLEIFKKLGYPSNFAYYYTSIGEYNYIEPNYSEGNTWRKLNTSKRLPNGMFSTIVGGEQLNINNTHRESSIFCATDTVLNFASNTKYSTYDNSSLNKALSSRFSSKEVGCADVESTRNIASPLAAMRVYNPNQYGNVSDIVWLGTGSFNYFDSSEIIYGGDTFITRFTLKRKQAFFKEDAMDVASLVPYKYSLYYNLKDPAFVIDYDVNSKRGLGGYIFPEVNSYVRADCVSGANDNYYESPTRFYLYSYGIPSILIESGYDNDLRIAGRDPSSSYYPVASDYVDWTQEKRVSIRQDNKYMYNENILINNPIIGVGVLPAIYDPKDALYNPQQDNTVIYSEKDISERDLLKSWLKYKPLNHTQLQLEDGRLISIDGIESNQILLRFQNKFQLHNAIDVLEGKQVSSVLGTGGLFMRRPADYIDTDLGLGGTLFKSLVSNMLGHFWVDSERGEVFKLGLNGQGVQVLDAGVSNFLQEQLPFKILQDVSGLTQLDLDNGVRGVGINLGYDPEYKRILLTKRDYTVRDDKQVSYSRVIGFYDTLTALPVSLSDNLYFVDRSFTIGYSVYSSQVSQSNGGWLSFYSYLPNFYLSLPYGKFLSGDSRVALWGHNLEVNHFQTFYGEQYPFKIETLAKTGIDNEVLQFISYNATKYLETTVNGKDGQAIVHDSIFNKVTVYNDENNTGEMLVHYFDNKNNYQRISYPKIQFPSQEVIVKRVGALNTINTLFNLLPVDPGTVWIYSDSLTDKAVNPLILNFKYDFWNKLRGSWFKVRYVNDEDFGHLILMRLAISGYKGNE